ncbi:MAG: hypothetical protein M3R02_30545 [Chloroflexota bacterium]|nr:hypothetical protein [Chloroflexota bacterium]
MERDVEVAVARLVVLHRLRAGKRLVAGGRVERDRGRLLGERRGEVPAGAREAETDRPGSKGVPDEVPPIEHSPHDLVHCCLLQVKPQRPRPSAPHHPNSQRAERSAAQGTRWATREAPGSSQRDGGVSTAPYRPG